MQIETERLILREMNEEDFDDLYCVLADSDIMQHYPYTFDEKRVRGWIEKNQERYQIFGFGLWAVCLKENGKMIGDCGLTLQPIGNTIKPEIGYHIQKTYQRKGYAKEAAIAVRDWAFTHTPFQTIYSYMKSTNLPSMQTAQAYGCQRVDEFVDAEKEKTTVFALSKKTWLEKYKMRQEKGAPLYQYFPCQKEKMAIEQIENLRQGNLPFQITSAKNTFDGICVEYDLQSAYAGFPCVKSLTFGGKTDAVCKRVLWNLCKEKQIDCYQLIPQAEQERVQLKDADFKINDEEEVDLLIRLVERICYSQEKIDECCERFQVMISMGNVDAGIIEEILSVVADQLTDTYFLKISMNQLCNRMQREAQRVSLPKQVEKLIEDVSQMVERVNQSLQELTESVPDSAKKGLIQKNDVERITKSIESAKKILQIVNHIEWYADNTH